MGEGLEIAKVLVAPLEKLIDVAKSGAGILYQPRHKRKMTDATVYEIEQVSEALRKNSDVLVSYNNGDVIVNVPEWNDFLARTKHRRICQELINQRNIEAVIDNAYSELEDEPAVTEEPVDTDWIARLFSIIKDISNEEMQYVWGKILAGEIKQPGSFSLRTLDAIRNMSQKEAEIFQKISPYILREGDKYFLLSDSKILEKYDIKYAEIMKLDECGLVNSGAHISLNLTISDSKDAEIFNTDKMLYIEGLSTNITKISFGDFALTSTGIELYSVISVSPDENIVFDVAKLIEKKNPQNIKMSIYKVNSIEGQTITYKSLPLREYMFKGK